MNQQEADIQAAWNDGYEARKEEMEQEDSGLTIGEVKGFSQDLANRIARLSYLIQNSLIHDKPLEPHQVSSEWRDELLTNVLVPFIRSILETETRNREFLVKEYKDISRTRGEAVTKEELTDTNARIETLMHAIHILQEWRG